METDIGPALEKVGRHVKLTPHELQEIRDNFQFYGSTINDLLKYISRYEQLKQELSKLSSEIAKLNFENYETYMAVHTNSIAISGHRAAIKISGQRLSKELERELEDILAKYLMMKF